jgi:N-acetylneuraminic acid mutarotase
LGDSKILLQLVGDWEKWDKYPINVAESMGAMVGDDFVIVSGFTRSWNSVTTKVYAYNVRDANAKWREMDDVPVPGFHHAAYAVDGLVMYICGAYVGGIENISDSPICLKYSHTAPIGQQWTRLLDMPSNRGGGGMNLIFETNSLVYATGASRKGNHVTDFDTTFELSLNNLSAGWSIRSAIPYKANHVSHVTAYYQGKPHYFVGGGQLEENESDGNQADLMEWDPATAKWIRRSNMHLARGHASSSTAAYGCGFIVIGGATNGGKTDDISYYAIDSDSWESIGKLPNDINTPVCDIVLNLAGSDWVYCQSGYYWGSFAWRRQITTPL